MKTSTPIPPVVSQETWSTLYKIGQNCLSLNPWATCNGSLFAFQDPISKQTIYCRIEKKGSFSKILLCKGIETLTAHLLEANKQISRESLALQDDSISIEFTSKKRLKKEDIAILTQIGFTEENNKFPFFRSIKPRSPAWFLSEAEAQICILALHSLAHHMSKDSLVTFPEISFYSPQNIDTLPHSWQTSTERLELPVKNSSPPLLPDTARIEKLKGMKLCRDSAWEVSVFLGSSIVFSNKRPHYDMVCLIAHQESSHILENLNLPLEVSPAVFLSEQILTAIEKHKRLPGEILFDNEDLYLAVKPLAKALGLRASLCKSLATIHPVRRQLQE